MINKLLNSRLDMNKLELNPPMVIDNKKTKLTYYQRKWIATTRKGPSLWCALFHSKYWVKKHKETWNKVSEKTRCKKCKQCWYNQFKLKTWEMNQSIKYYLGNYGYILLLECGEQGMEELGCKI